MKKEATAHAAEDKLKKEEIEAKNQADNIVYQTEKQMEELKDKLEADDKSKLETALGRLKEAQKGTNIDELKSATEDLNKIWNEIAQKVYAQTGAGAQGQPGAGPDMGTGAGPGASEAPPGGGNGEQKVEDADYEVVDDEKKDKDKKN
jgi:molecular chaperone DnaK